MVSRKRTGRDVTMALMPHMLQPENETSRLRAQQIPRPRNPPVPIHTASANSGRIEAGFRGGVDRGRRTGLEFDGRIVAGLDVPLRIGAAGEEVQLAEVQDAVAADRGLKREGELFQRFAGGEARGLDAGLAAVAAAAVGFGLQKDRGELLIAPVLGAGAVGELRQRPGGGGCFELAKEVCELGRWAAHAINAS
jgi:hypothetical protein